MTLTAVACILDDCDRTEEPGIAIGDTRIEWRFNRKLPPVAVGIFAENFAEVRVGLPPRWQQVFVGNAAKMLMTCGRKQP